MARTLIFRVPLEEPQPTLLTLFERAWPEGTHAQIVELLAKGRVRVDDRISKNPDKAPEPEEVCEIDITVGEAVFSFPEANELARGEGWVVVSKPAGTPTELDRDDPMNPVLFLADSLGADRATFTPVWTMDTTMQGPWLCALDAPTAISLRKDCASGALTTTWTAICVAPAMAAGVWTHQDVTVQYATTRTQNGLSEVQLTPQFGGKSLDPVPFLLSLLEDQGCPVVGARFNGGHLAAGGLRLQLSVLLHSNGDLAHSWNPEKDWWPKAPVVPQREVEVVRRGAHRTTARPTLLVSHTTLDVLEQRGHPWVLKDKDTGDCAGLKPGTLVQLAAKNGRKGPFALIEGPGDLVARFWGDDEESAKFFVDEVVLRLDEAIARRGEQFANMATTDVFRLVHAEADGLPGFYLDRCGPILRATIAGGAAMGYRKLIYDSLVDTDPKAVILETRHLEDIRAKGGELPRARVLRGGSIYVEPGKKMIVRELGLKYWIDPWEGIDIGFFADQRDNRKHLLGADRSQERWLNLFCHTGAFSVVLRSLGAHVTSVDVSKRYLDWLRANLELNGLASDFVNAADDARAFLKHDKTVYDGIIVDPPTAARGSKGFWSVRKDYENHLVQCFQHLKPSGTMLVCRNDRKKTRSLAEVVYAAAKRADVKVRSVEDAPASSDYPSLDGFPESIKSEALWVSI